jgi:hypothetical protein
MNGCFFIADGARILKPTAKHAAVPFIPFKTAFSGQTNGKTNGNAVHSAV